MSPREQEFLNRLRATFREEAAEYVQAMAAELLALEQGWPAAAGERPYETIFRTAHSLKGAARAVSATDIEAICQRLESVFAQWKQGAKQPTAESFDVLHQAVDLLGHLRAEVGTVSPRPRPANVGAMLERLRAVSEEGEAIPGAPLVSGPLVPLLGPPSPSAVASVSAPAPVAPVAPDQKLAGTVRVPEDKLDSLRQGVEELLHLKQAARKRVGELREVNAHSAQWRQQHGQVRRSQRALDDLLAAAAAAGWAGAEEMTAVWREVRDFLDWSAAHARSLEATGAAAQAAARREEFAASKLVDGVLRDIKHLLLLPVSTITDSLPVLARRLGRERGKAVELSVRGGEVELDKRVLDELKDPLLHLVRNAVDHGVEPADDRVRRQKPAAATVTITIRTLDGTKAEIVVADDGGGIDAAKVRAAAIKRRVISEADAAALDEAQARALVFHSDVTTSPIVTDISGRGLGLAIVREKVEKLGGTVGLETGVGQGTRFRLVLPIAQAAFRGLVVRVGGRHLIVPATAVERMALVVPSALRTVENRETLCYGGRVLSLARLAPLLGIAEARTEGAAPTTRPAIVLGSGDERIAFLVDAVVHDEEVLVRPLAPPLRRVRNVLGAATLASGELVPVLHPADLLKSARRGAGGVQPAGAPAAAAARSVLIAEDSITSRMLIKGILESAGYRVKTAADGVEALEALRSDHFDLVVSDIQMPRMNGFDLTRRIRAERRLAETPVVLLTALAAPEDRAQGIDVGADAYLVKSEFDQGNLLEIVRRLA